ncbi:MAG: maleylpyruvate isomerase family mycothiol-dependent enzyme [Actinomycetota bacterium]|nr:maleylpyruvate isomerase family mycothiol-dependent enzyme [Actinomycetota bacterium]
MPNADPWPMIHTERKALAADLEPLSAQQWATPSLCQGWTVQQVLGHMAATAAITPGRFFPKLVASGFRFNAMVAKDIANQTAGAPAETLANFYQGSNLIIGAKKGIAGLTLRATDAEWSTGTGPEVTGPMLSLVLAMTGREAGLDDLAGNGLATLAGRG